MSDSDANAAPEDRATPDEDEHTVMVDRGAPADAEPDAGEPDEGEPDEDEHTVMVDRAKASDGSEPDAGEPDEDEHTVMVDRGAPADAEPDAGEPDEDEHTVMVDRAKADEDEPDAGEPDEDEHTVMVDRAKADEDEPDAGEPDEDEHTVMVDRAKASDGSEPDEDEHTVVVDKAAKSKLPPRSKPQLQPTPTAARRRGIAPPPVPRGFAPQAVEVPGAGATEIYRPRAIPELPPAAPTIVESNVATREASATMPSVARHAKITARVAIVVFVAACVASVVGLTLIALTLI